MVTEPSTNYEPRSTKNEHTRELSPIRYSIIELRTTIRTTTMPDQEEETETNAQRDLNLRIEILDEIMKQSKDLIALEEPPTKDVRAAIGMIKTAFPMVEKYKPKQSGTSDEYNYNEIAARLVLNAQIRIAHLQTIIEDTEARRNYQGAVPQQNTQALHTTMAKSPDIKIPTFTGDCSDFPEFLETFNVATERLTKPQKLAILRQSVNSTVLIQIKSFPLTDDGFARAMKKLEETYLVTSRIKHQLREKLRTMTPANDTATSIRATYEAIEAILTSLETYEGTAAVAENESYRCLVMAKFPHNVLHALAPGQVLTLPIIRTHTKLLIEAREDVDSIIQSTTGSEIKQATAAAFLVTPMSRKVRDSNAVVDPVIYQRIEYPRSCVYCKNTDHYSNQCKKFSTAVERVKQLPENSCYSCLRSGHSSKRCRSARPCYHCSREGHHRSLCPKQFGFFVETRREVTALNQKSEDKPEQRTEPNDNSGISLVAMAQSSGGNQMIAKAKIQNTFTGEILTVRIFLDSGSNKSYITDRIAKKLKLAPINVQLIDFRVFLDVRVPQVKSNVTQFRLLSDHDPKFKCVITAGTVPIIAENLDTINVEEFKRQYPQYDNLPYVDPMNGEAIDVIVGSDYFWSTITNDPQKTILPDFHIVHTVFGWSPSGNTSSSSLTTHRVLLSAADALKQLTTLEILGISDRNNSRSEEEKLALAQFTEDITFDEVENRYAINWPWRESPPDLPTNFSLAKGCLSSLIKKYNKDPKYLIACEEIFQRQLTSGIIEPVADAGPSANTHYLPFHFIIEENKSTPLKVEYHKCSAILTEHFNHPTCGGFVSTLERAN